MAKSFEIIFYEKEDGTKPAKEFIDSLTPRMSAKIMRIIDILKTQGPALREPYSKSLDDGIFEIRTKLGSDVTRVLYFFMVGKRVIITNGFVKKTLKTPAREIELAKKYRADYIERNKGQEG